MGTTDILSTYEGIPSRALVMGGNWDLNTDPDELVLSPESKLRVRALGVLATYGYVNMAIFTAGLTRGTDETTEATRQHSFLLEEFPHLHGMELHEEDMGHTTKADAIHTRHLVEELGITGPFTLISTQAYLKRQTKVFEHEGFRIQPVAAEPVVATISPLRASEVCDYSRSLRHKKIVASEFLLRGLQIFDKESVVTEAIARRSRSNHKTD